MSRIGRKPIPIPKGVDIKIADGTVQVKGPKGLLSVDLVPGIGAEAKDGNLEITRENEEKKTRAFHGLVRALIANAAAGVTEGWKKELEIMVSDIAPKRKRKRLSSTSVIPIR